MNDNKPLNEFDLPDWAWNILDRHALEQRVKEVRVMIDDAISLAVLCPRDPVPGILTELEDGTLQWTDASAPDLSNDLDPPPDADDQQSGETNDLDLIDWSD